MPDTGMCSWSDVDLALKQEAQKARLRLERDYQIVRLNALFAARVHERQIAEATATMLSEIEEALAMEYM
jgi:hypothetical protein